MKSRLCVQMQFDVTLVIIKLLNSLMSGDVFNVHLIILVLILTVTNCAFVVLAVFSMSLNCPCVAAA